MCLWFSLHFLNTLEVRQAGTAGSDWIYRTIRFSNDDFPWLGIIAQSCNFTPSKHATKGCIDQYGAVHLA
jgi:hypothetical protein